MHFHSHVDGRKIFMGPEQSMQIQSNLGSTIAMAFDECPPESVPTREYVENSVARTTRWLIRCKAELERLNGPAGYSESAPDALRHQPGRHVCGHPDRAREAYLRAGSRTDMRLAAWRLARVTRRCTVSWTRRFRICLWSKPTYLMGVGTPANILEAVDRGVDFFDCVYPSRNGRHGHVYTNYGKKNLLNREVRAGRPSHRTRLQLSGLP